MAESDNILTKLQDLLVYLIPQLNKFPPAADIANEQKRIWRLRPNHTAAKNWSPSGQPAST